MSKCADCVATVVRRARFCPFFICTSSPDRHSRGGARLSLVASPAKTRSCSPLSFTASQRIESDCIYTQRVLS
jgi:hypothetical protein